MRTFEQYIREAVDFRLGGKENKGVRYNYAPKDNDDLWRLMRKLIKERGAEGDFNDIDTSRVEDMSFIFHDINNDFNGDVSLWDTSKAVNMESMFENAHSFNGDISMWDTSSAKSMREMFYSAESFNQDISDWNVSHVINFAYMFKNAKSFNQNISSWDVSKGIINNGVFDGCPIKEEFKPKFK